MKFIKFWWKFSLRKYLLAVIGFITWLWLSGHIYWWMYRNVSGENHTEAAAATLVFWFIALLVLFVVMFLAVIVIDYFDDLWRAYKDAQP